MIDYDRFGRRKTTSAAAKGAGNTSPGPDRLHPYGFDRSDVDHNKAALRFAREIHRLPPARAELVFRVRRQIAEGVYETPEKLESAVEALYTRAFAEPDSSP